MLHRAFNYLAIADYRDIPAITVVLMSIVCFVTQMRNAPGVYCLLYPTQLLHSVILYLSGCRKVGRIQLASNK